MPWNTLESYGGGGSGFIDEGEQPLETDSLYRRKAEKPDRQCPDYISQSGQVCGNQNTCTRFKKDCPCEVRI